MVSVPEATIRVVALTPRGASLAREISRGLPGARCWLARSQAGEDPEEQTFDRVATVFEEAFRRGENLVAVMAAGIVVRSIAPHLQGKAQDPAVVVVDEAGQFAISLLSGHQGGANQLARQVAQIIKGTPVITTASDLQGLPALDLAALRAGLAIENPAALSQRADGVSSPVRVCAWWTRTASWPNSPKSIPSESSVRQTSTPPWRGAGPGCTLAFGSAPGLRPGWCSVLKIWWLAWDATRAPPPTKS